MPSNGNGIGTVHYGHSGEADDGSYVTTVWVVFFFLPIFPLRSERILPLSRFDNGAGYSNLRYSVLGRVAISWPAIAKTYLLGWGTLGWYVSLAFAYDPLARLFGQNQGIWIFLGWFSVPAIVVAIWYQWFRPRPKLKPVQVLPGSEFSVFRKVEPKDQRRG